MRKIYSAICVLSLGVFALTQAGCTKTAPTPAANTNTATTGHDHEHEGHDHSHDHRHGSHGGEIVVAEPGHFDIEWTHDHDTDELAVYVDGKKVEKAHILLEVTGGEPKKYELTAGEDGKLAIKDKELIVSVDASEDEKSTITPFIVVVVDGAEHKAELKVVHH